ncbi:MAG: DUF3299 domain-containing protein [Gemmatimonadetes bacterium]|nr:DUF3299 domain-containing protein [Gemmatimonadota bacterium]
MLKSVRVSSWIRIGTVVAGLAGGGASPVQAQVPYAKVDFYILSNYNYSIDEPFEPTPVKPAGNTIPTSVRAYEGRKVFIRGNAVALDYSSGFMTEFLLHPTLDACEFGGTPRINEWIFVKMAEGKKVKIFTGYAVEVRGSFAIKEEIERGRVVGLYNMVADDVVAQ